MPKGPYRGRSRFVPAGMGFSDPSEFSAPDDTTDEGAIAEPKRPKRKPDYIADTEALLEQEP